VGRRSEVKPAGLSILVWFVVIYININKFAPSNFVVSLSRIIMNRTWSRFGVVRQIWWTCQSLIFFKIWIRVVIVLLSPSTRQPLIGPCNILSFSAYAIPSMSSYHVSAMSSFHITIWTIRVPRGTILLVHGLVQKCQNRVTHGSLWCCHITMLTSC
jgi:hypothetical protein